jgi:hypothetical protein
MRRDSAWRDVMAMPEQLMQRVDDLSASVEQLKADAALPVPAPRPRRLAKILLFRRPA